MGIFYIDPTATIPGSGSSNSPFQNISDATLASGNNYYFKCDTVHPNLTAKISPFGFDNITFGAYYGDGIVGVSGAKPILQYYATTNTPFTETFGGSNIWRWAHGTGKDSRILGIGSLGDDTTSSWTDRKIHVVGTNATGTDFDDLDAKQWDGDNTYLYIYSSSEPVARWGTIYYTNAGDHQIFSIGGNTSDITVENLDLRYGHECLRASPFAGNTITNFTVQNCDFAHNYVAITLGVDAAFIDNAKILNNTIVKNGRNGIYTHGDNVNNPFLIEGNTIIDSSMTDGWGAIYIVSDGLSDNKNIVQNNYIDTVYESSYWLEGYGLYTDGPVGGASNNIYRRNYVTGCESSGLQDNSGNVGNEYYSNIIENCPIGMRITDSSQNNLADTQYYNNTFNGVGIGVWMYLNGSGGHASTVKNNIFVASGTATYGISINTIADDLAGSLDEDYNDFYGFPTTKFRNASGTLQQLFGVNNIEMDPLLDSKYKPKAALV
jgi:hypothetical protein